MYIHILYVKKEKKKKDRKDQRNVSISQKVILIGTLSSDRVRSRSFSGILSPEKVKCKQRPQSLRSWTVYHFARKFHKSLRYATATNSRYVLLLSVLIQLSIFIILHYFGLCVGNLTQTCR